MSSEDLTRVFTVLALHAMLDPDKDLRDLPKSIQTYIARRLLPILEREEAAARGRGDRAPGAGEMVQALIQGGVEQVAARKRVQERTGLKYASVSKAHTKFLKSGKRALLYKTTITQR